jgi:hypothetical protein
MFKGGDASAIQLQAAGRAMRIIAVALKMSD